MSVKADLAMLLTCDNLKKDLVALRLCVHDD